MAKLVFPDFDRALNLAEYARRTTRNGFTKGNPGQVGQILQLQIEREINRAGIPKETGLRAAYKLLLQPDRMYTIQTLAMYSYGGAAVGLVEAGLENWRRRRGS